MDFLSEHTMFWVVCSFLEYTDGLNEENSQEACGMKFWKKFGWFMLGLTPMVAVLLWQNLVSGVGIGIYSAMQGMQAIRTGTDMPTYEQLLWGFMNGTPYAITLFAVYTGYLLIFGLWYWLMFCRKRQSGNWKQVVKPQRIGGIIGCGIALQLAISMALSLILPLFPKLMEYYSTVMEALDSDSVFIIICVCILAPIGEELIFRGLTMRTMEKAMPWQAALVIQAVLFGVYHFNLVQGIYAVLLGLVLGYFAHRYGSVIPGILLHMVINSFSYALEYILPASLEQHAGIMLLICIAGLAVAAGSGILTIKGVKPAKHHD